MTQEIGGVVFDLSFDQSGALSLSVVGLCDNCAAIEFIVELTDKSWASDVVATKVGSLVVVPRFSGDSRAKVRLFNTVGCEIAVEGDNVIAFPRAIFGKNFSKRGGASFFYKCLISVCLFVGIVFVFVDFHASPDSIILARNAHFRSAADLSKSNVIGTLPFGTQLYTLSQSGEFFEVRVLGGQKGYVRKDVVGDAKRGLELGLKDSLEQARTVVDDQRGLILKAGAEFKASLLNSASSLEMQVNKESLLFQNAISKTVGDEVKGKFFHYLAEEAGSRKNYRDALTYFRAASISNPLSVDDVHGWGITQLRSFDTVDESAALHAVVLSPRSTNTWLMVAGYLSSQTALGSETYSVSALRLAVLYSTDQNVTKRVFRDLSRSTRSEKLRGALVDVLGGS